MNKLEKAMLRLLILAIIIIPIVHFMVPGGSEQPPAVPTINTPVVMPNIVKKFKMPLPEDTELNTELSYKGKVKNISFSIPDKSKSFGARSKEIRLMLAKMNGGGDETENAMEMALGYLSRTQKSDGSWSQKEPLGSTGLAMVAFLGAGYNHMEGEYSEQIAKGLKYMLDNQDENGDMKHGNLYTEGIALIAFSEAYGLTNDQTMKKAAEKLITLLAAGQGPQGGWHYTPWDETKGDKYPYDTSVTGWVMMGFKSAKMAGIKVPKEIINKYLSYADLITDDVGISYYGLGGDGKMHKGHKETMTASTLMCRLYMGIDKKSPKITKGLAHIMDTLPVHKKPEWAEGKGKMDAYMWYHAAQVGFLMGGKTWKFWNEPLRELLTEKQIKDGSRKGAWTDEYFKFSDRSEVYVTCLNIYTLQTYYRYYK